MRFIGMIVVLGAVMVPVIGCEESPVVPPPPVQREAEAQTEVDEPAPPTTQELMSAPRRRLSLGVVPLSVEVPPGWSLETLGAGMTLLEGPTPAGRAQVQLARRPVVPAERLEDLIARSRRDAEQNPGQFAKLAVRPFGAAGGQILEKQAAGAAIPAEYDEDGNEILPAATAYAWTITVFQPIGDGFEPYELNFIALTREQYEQDQELLRRIIDSLEYDASGSEPPPVAP